MELELQAPESAMEVCMPTLRQIRENVVFHDGKGFSNVLLLYDEKITLLGDCCMRFSRFKYMKSYFKEATITVNFTDKHNDKYIDSLLKNNPYVDVISRRQWEEMDFTAYDLILAIVLDERRLLTFLDQQYGSAIREQRWRPAVCSFSSLIFEPEEAHVLFPVDEGLQAFLIIPRSAELYISAEERTFADQWFRSKGLQPHEKVSVLIDSSSYKGKLLDTEVYFGVLKYLLQRPAAKILIFDEGSAGKEAYYREHLGPEEMERIIFSKGLTLRQDLCLIAADCIEMVLGPCSGLMHCASNIYNHYVSGGLPVSDVPLLVVYAGLYGEKSYDLNNWWGESPLVHCILLKEENGEKRLRKLSDLPREAAANTLRLPCSGYTTTMLTDFLKNNLH